MMDAFTQFLKDTQPWLTLALTAIGAVIMLFIKLRENKKLQAVQHAHELDLQKRKYQYESKRDEYIRFLHLLETLHQDVTTQKAHNLFDGFPMNGDEKEMEAYLQHLPNRMMEYVQQSSDVLARIKSETLTIRLVADKELIALLDEYSSLCERALDSTTKYIQAMPQLAASPNSVSDKTDVIDPSLKTDLETTWQSIQEHMKASLEEI